MIDGEEWVAADTVASEVTARILQHALSGSPRPRPRPRQSNGYGAARQAEFGQEQVNPALCKIVRHPHTYSHMPLFPRNESGVCRVPIFFQFQFQ